MVSGTVTDADLGHHRLEPFVVPEGTRRITVDFQHTVSTPASVLDLGLFDPHMRSRGWSAHYKPSFTVSEVDASPSYWPGLIPPGTWYLSISVPWIRPGTSDAYTLRVALSSSLEPETPAVLDARPGWYRGELHAHTGLSDGVCPSLSGRTVPCPEFKVVEAAAARGLQFLAVTDHNTTSGEPSYVRWQPYFDTLLLVRGRELTTFRGHANVYGSADDFDFRVGPGGRTLAQTLDDAHRAGAIVSINHPERPGGEACTGCHWDYAPEEYAGRIDAVETVNGTVLHTGFWDREIARGRRVPGIGGSDDHHSGGKVDERIGLPTTVVYARELSERAILEGIRAGHVYVRLPGPEGPAAVFEARAGGGTAIMGDTLRAGKRERVDFSLSVSSAAGSTVAILEDGKPAALLKDSRIAAAEERKGFRVVSDGRRHWIRVELHAADGAPSLVTNPIYLNFD